MRKTVNVLCFLALTGIIFSGSLYAQNTLDLRFAVVTNNGTNFDVKVQCQRSGGWDKLGTSTFAFNFNTTGLSSPSLQTAHNFSGGNYGVLTVTDNTTYATIGIVLNSAPGTDVPSGSWIDVATIRFTVDDPAETSNLVWRTGDFVCSDDGGGTVVTAGTLTGLDVSLPVSMQAMAASASPEGYVVVTWETASEVSAYGYKVYRSAAMEGAYACLTNEPIASKGQSSAGHTYEYIDRTAQKGMQYWYKIQEITTDGQKLFSPPFMAAVPPAEFTLAQNYPNPFNPVTYINYTVPRETRVSIKVYNVFGREIKTLVNGTLPAKAYTAEWNGTDSRGTLVSSGIYLIQMKAGSFTALRKITLMR